MSDLVLVVDCGSTNITSAAVDAQGNVLASVSEPNGTAAQPGGPGEWVITDMEALWRRVCKTTSGLCEEVGADRIAAVTIATWGADGAPVRADGTLTYPIINWQCPRTQPVLRRMVERLGEKHLFNVTGYQAISFNTVFKIAWLRENASEALDEADAWLMVAGLLSQRLTGRMSLDVTGASTMMMLDLAKLDWAPELLEACGVDASLFPPLIYPGEVIGEVTADAAGATGLAEGTPVVASGHDTQFAPVGSGAGEDEAILSTGTWEIAMLRTAEPATGDRAFEDGILTEVDAVPGLYNPQLLMMGSGVLEWVRENLYGEIEERGRAYETMIGEARQLKPGAGGLMMVPSFVPDTGPFRKYGTQGTLVGLGLTTTRAHVYRAALEGLCFQLKEALRILGEATGFRPERLRVVGGGSKNELWNRLRADVCGLPVVVTERRDATVLGAAVAAWVGAGRFASIPEGQEQVLIPSQTLEPSDRSGAYAALGGRYALIAPELAGFYRGRA